MYLKSFPVFSQFMFNFIPVFPNNTVFYSTPNFIPVLCSKCWRPQTPRHQSQCCSSSSSPSIPRGGTFFNKIIFLWYFMIFHDIFMIFPFLVEEPCSTKWYFHQRFFLSHDDILGEVLILDFTIICKLVLSISGWNLQKEQSRKEGKRGK